MGVLRATLVLFLFRLLPPQAARGGWFHLETVVGEGLVGLGHAVDFFLLLHRAAASFRGLHQLVGKALGHALLPALAGRLADPAHRQRRAAHGTHLDRDLVVRAAHAPALHLDHR